MIRRFKWLLFMCCLLWPVVHCAQPSDNSVAIKRLNEVYLQIRQPNIEIDQQAEILTKTINHSSSPEKQILNLWLGELYYDYYLTHLDQLQNQPTETEDEHEISTWSADRLIRKARSVFLESTSALDTLVTFQSEDWKPLIPTGSDDQAFRPTLAEIMAHRALDFFTDPKTNLKPAPPVVRMQAQRLILTPEDFIQATWPEMDSANHAFISLSIFTKILQQQLEYKHTYALIDTELRLIKWLQDYASGLDKAGRYARVLNILVQQYQNHPAQAEVNYELAFLYATLAQYHQPLGGMAHKWDYQQAWQICRNTIYEYPQTRGAKRAKTLEELIEKPRLRVEIEAINLPDQPFRQQLIYRNLLKLYYRIYLITPELAQRLKNQRMVTEKLDMIRDKPIFKSGSTFLPNDGDFHYHRTEIRLPPLPVGHYVIVSSNNDTFDPENQAVALVQTKVSHWALLSNKADERTDFFLIHRKTGRPIAQIPAIFIPFRTDQADTLNMQTDSLGKVSIPQDYSGTVIFKQGEEYLAEEIRQRLSRNSIYKNAYQTLLYTDKAVYQPADLVSFQGMLIRKFEDHFEFVKDSTLAVFLANERMQVIDTIEVYCGSQGSFSGEIALPPYVREGKMFLLSGAGFVEINIAPQPIPAFDIWLRQEKENYGPEDSVRLLGQLIANPEVDITDAQVRYIITRDVRFPHWPDYSWWRPIPQHNEVLLKQGTAEISADGSFDIPFKAKYDPSHPASQHPVYFYKIRVLATDPDGKRHLQNYNLLLSDAGKSIAIQAPQQIIKGAPLNAEIRQIDLRGNKVPLQGNIGIARLEEPDTLYRRRRWLVPDIHLASLQDYRADFPQDVYGFEDDFRSWPTDSLLWEDSLEYSLEAWIISQETSNWPAGKYRIKYASADTGKQAIRAIHYFTLTDTMAPQPPFPQILDMSVSQDTAFPGDDIRLDLRTSLPELWVLYQLFHGPDLVESEFFCIANNRTGRNIAVKKKYKGELQLRVSFVYANEVFEEREAVIVQEFEPLLIEWQAVPQKLVSGRNEGFNIHVKDRNGQPVQAEIMASLIRKGSLGFETARFDFRLHAQSRRPAPSVQAEGTNAAMGSGAVWGRELDFPISSYSDIQRIFGESPAHAPNPLAESAFRDLADGLLRLPENRRGHPPQHRWINLYANVTDDSRPFPGWIAKKIVEQQSYEIPPPGFLRLMTDEEGKGAWTYPVPALPGTWHWLVAAHTVDGGFGFVRLPIEVERKNYLEKSPYIPDFTHERVFPKDRIFFAAEKKKKTIIPLDTIPPTKPVISSFLELFQIFSFAFSEHQMDTIEAINIQYFGWSAIDSLAKKEHSYAQLFNLLLGDSLSKEDIERRKYFYEAAIRNHQRSNGAFSGTEDNFETLNTLQYHHLLSQMGIQFSPIHQRSIEHAWLYLDSLYLHPLPQEMELGESEAVYVHLRRQHLDIPIAEAWQASWQALNALLEAEDSSSPIFTSSIDKNLQVLYSHWSMFTQKPEEILQPPSWMKWKIHKGKLIIRKKRKEALGVFIPR